MRQELSDAIEDYLGLRLSQDYSKRTLANERTILKSFLQTNGNIWVHQIDVAQVTRHFEKASQTRASGALQLDHTVLGQFFVWARQTRRMPQDRNPLAGRRRPKVRKRERLRIPPSQFSVLLDTASEIGARERAVIATLLYTLARDQEIANIRISDVSLEGGYIRTQVTKTYTEDLMPIPTELDSELRQWLATYTQAVGPLHDHYFLLPRRKSVGLVKAERGLIVGHNWAYMPERKIGRLGRVVGNVLDDFGWPMEDPVTGKRNMEGAHTIRRSGARALFDRLVDGGYDHSLRIVQSQLHHASMAQTEHYIGIEADRRNRDEILRGKMMYPTSDTNVVRLSV
jgi:integrase